MHDEVITRMQCTYEDKIRIKTLIARRVAPRALQSLGLLGGLGPHVLPSNLLTSFPAKKSAGLATAESECGEEDAVESLPRQLLEERLSNSTRGRPTIEVRQGSPLSSAFG